MTQLTERKEERKMTRGELAKKLDAMHERDNEKVTGIFRYIEHQGGTLRFMFKKYPQDELKKYEFTDGERYQIPRMVARHLNQGIHYTEYKHLDNNFGEQGIRGAINDGSGKLRGHMYATRKVPRCEFRSLEFMDEDLDMVPNRIIEVTSKP